MELMNVCTADVVTKLDSRSCNGISGAVAAGWCCSGAGTGVGPPSSPSSLKLVQPCSTNPVKFWESLSHLPGVPKSKTARCARCARCALCACSCSTSASGASRPSSFGSDYARHHAWANHTWADAGPGSTTIKACSTTCTAACAASCCIPNAAIAASSATVGAAACATTRSSIWGCGTKDSECALQSYNSCVIWTLEQRQLWKLQMFVSWKVSLRKICRTLASLDPATASRNPCHGISAAVRMPLVPQQGVPQLGDER